MILRDETDIVRDRQKLIRRELDRRGIPLKQVQLDGGWDTTSTVASYFPADEAKEPAIMSVAALHRMLKRAALPVDLASLLLPEGFGIVHLPEGIDLDELAADFQAFLRAKQEAHHPDSEAGRDIGPSEASNLLILATRAGRKVAA